MRLVAEFSFTIFPMIATGRLKPHVRLFVFFLLLLCAWLLTFSLILFLILSYWNSTELKEWNLQPLSSSSSSSSSFPLARPQDSCFVCVFVYFYVFRLNASIVFIP